MRRILFVDDEAMVLKGLRRLLSPMRKQWDMRFVEGGQAALDALREQEAEVVVADMRMPGMDGHALLTEVSKLYPDTARIILTGQTDESKIAECFDVVHQFLSKPCDQETLVRVLEGVLSARKLLSNPKLREVLTRLCDLPSPPTIYARLMAELQKPDSSVEEVAEIVSTDPAMSAKILRVVNSPYFGMFRSITHPRQAVTLLGLDMVQGMVLSTHLFSRFERETFDGFSLQGLWDHSLRCSNLIVRMGMADPEFGRHADAAAISALLHDVGKLVLMSNMPEEYRQVLAIVRSGQSSLFKAEREVFGADHALVGAYLLRLWGLPEQVCEAIEHHHDPKSLTSGHVVDMGLFVANVLDHGLFVINDDYSRRASSMAMIETSNILPAFSRWKETAMRMYDEVGGDG